jgi:hypothetical protein
MNKYQAIEFLLGIVGLWTVLCALADLVIKPARPQCGRGSKLPKPLKDMRSSLERFKVER